jgi:transmembrane sensor
MAQRESSRDIDQAASEWTARLDRGPLTAQDEAAFQAWLAGDARRKGAMLRAQALSMMSESARALGDGFDPADFSEPGGARFSRRQALTWGGGAAAAASLAALAIGLPAAAGAVISTERGEIRLAPLKDGSTVLLNTETRIRVRYETGRRVVALLSGEAYFSVARDDRRPFVVEVNGRRLSTAQANFRVRNLKREPVDVLVNQGLVDIAPAAASARAVRLASNTRMELSTRPVAERPQAMAPEAVTRELAWREGKLAFEGETLGQAAATFARYSDTRIQIGDPALAREPVTGLFAANDPAGFSRAVARVFDAKVDQQGDTLVISRRSVAE